MLPATFSGGRGKGGYMKKNMMLALAVLLSFGLGTSTYAGQGQTGFGGVSGQASADDLDMKSAPAAAPAVEPAKKVEPAPAPAPMKRKDSPPSVTKKKSKRVAKTTDTEMKGAPHKTSTTVTSRTPRQPAMSADSSLKSTEAKRKNAKVASGTAARNATANQRNMKSAPAQPVATAPVPPSIPLGASTVEGEVLRINGDSYIVKDVSGKNVRLQVDKDTKIGSNISTHDMVEVHASEVSGMTGSNQNQAPKNAWHADSIEKR
jgi:hypothetical protein